LCWRVTLSVFLSILIVEAIILIPSFKNYERDLLRRLEDAGLAAISAGLGSHIGASHSHMLEIGEAILSSPRVRGGALYDGKGTLVGSFGEIPELTPAQARQPGKARVRRDGGARYEVSWTSADSGLPFNVVGRLDASWIDGELTDFLWRIAGLVFMISVFVSGVAILILGRLILGPMLELRSKMVAARDDPANADLYKIEMTRRDELGDMVEALNNLLHSVSQTRRDELKAREERFRDFAGAASDWFWEMDEDLRFCCWANDARTPALPPMSTRRSGGNIWTIWRPTGRSATSSIPALIPTAGLSICRSTESRSLIGTAISWATGAPAPRSPPRLRPVVKPRRRRPA
jgi:hypothetical protein